MSLMPKIQKHAQITFLHLACRIREARQSHNITQAELAKRCNLHRTFIGSVERGERNLSILNLKLIAEKLGISIERLCRGL